MSKACVKVIKIQHRDVIKKSLLIIDQRSFFYFEKFEPHEQLQSHTRCESNLGQHGE